MIARAFTLAVVCLLAVSPTAGQVAVEVISGPEACRDCRIQRYLVAHIDESAFPGVVGFGGTEAIVLTDGHILLVPRYLRTPHVADRNGRVVRELGRQGAGLGEYGRVSGYLEFSRGFLVFDSRLHRVTRLSRSFEFETVANMPPLNVLRPVVALEDGSFVVNGTLRGVAPTNPQYPLHLVSPNGNLVRSFGGVLRNEPAPWRRVTQSREGTLLVAPREGAYRIERWDTAGRLLRVYERQASWFPLNATGDHSKPSILGIHEDADGLLWVLTVFFDPRPEDLRPGQPHMFTGRTIVDVLDLEARRVIRTAICSCIGGEVSGGPYFWHYAEEAGGTPRFSIWGFRLAR